jgi:hypothetical protein
LKLEGLFLTIFESLGTETANYAYFARFLDVFNLFAPETYKNTIQGYFLYFEAFLSVFKCFCSSDGTKMMSIYTLINPVQIQYNQSKILLSLKFIKNKNPTNKIIITSSSRVKKLSVERTTDPSSSTNQKQICYKTGSIKHNNKK